MPDKTTHTLLIRAKRNLRPTALDRSFQSGQPFLTGDVALRVEREKKERMLRDVIQGSRPIRTLECATPPYFFVRFWLSVSVEKRLFYVPQGGARGVGVYNVSGWDGTTFFFIVCFCCVESAGGGGAFILGHNYSYELLLF